MVQFSDLSGCPEEGLYVLLLYFSLFSHLVSQVGEWCPPSVGSWMNLKNSLSHLTDPFPKFYSDQKVHKFDAAFDAHRLYVAVILNCSSFSENYQKKTCCALMIAPVFPKFGTVQSTQL